MKPKTPAYFANHDNIAFPTGREDYEPHTAWWLAQCSWLSYDSKLNIAKHLNQVGFDHLYYFDMRGTQGFLTLHPGDGNRFAVLAFRGTEKDYLDILTDIIILKTKLPDVEDKEYGEGKLFAHGGFLQAFQSVWGAALPNEIKGYMAEAEWVGPRGVSDVIRDKIGDSGIPLYVTGHSLGGAIATLTAYHASSYHPNLHLYTFGSPRVTNSLLSRKISRTLGKRSHRCVHGVDIVPRIPPLFNYTHISDLVYFDPKRGKVPAKGNMPNDVLVILLLHLDVILLLLSLSFRKPKTTAAHMIANYIKAIQKEPLLRRSSSATPAP